MKRRYSKAKTLQEILMKRKEKENINVILIR
jgi:hypothetical protein